MSGRRLAMLTVAIVLLGLAARILAGYAAEHAAEHAAARSAIREALADRDAGVRTGAAKELVRLGVERDRAFEVLAGGVRGGASGRRSRR